MWGCWGHLCLPILLLACRQMPVQGCHQARALGLITERSQVGTEAKADAGLLVGMRELSVQMPFIQQGSHSCCCPAVEGAEAHVLHSAMLLACKLAVGPA